MMVFFQLYGWPIVAGTLMASALSMLGIQLAARDRAMQSVCVGQGASLGVLLGMGFGFYPFLTGLVAAFAIAFFTDGIAKKKQASRNTLFAAVFAILMALSQLIASLLPGLEMHMTQMFFGDLSTLLDTDAKVACGVSVLLNAFLVCSMKRLTAYTFEANLVGESNSLRKDRIEVRFFLIVAIAVVCLCVQYLGLLFTVTCLFVPTAVLSQWGPKGLWSHIVLSGVVGTLSTLAGFLLSLKISRLPTVPTVVAMMVCVLLVVVLLNQLKVVTRREV